MCHRNTTPIRVAYPLIAFATDMSSLCYMLVPNQLFIATQARPFAHHPVRYVSYNVEYGTVHPPTYHTQLCAISRIPCAESPRRCAREQNLEYMNLKAKKLLNNVISDIVGKLFS